jgi:hypothetical protein
VVKARFTPHPSLPGRLVNERLLKEREKQQVWRDKSSSGGKKGAASRWKKDTSEVNKGGHKVVTHPPLGCDDQTMTLQFPVSSLLSTPIVPKGTSVWSPSQTQLRLGALFKRRASTKWSDREIKSFKNIGEIPDDDLRLIEKYYTASFEVGKSILRRDILTLLNNWNGEVDRARAYKPQATKLW